MKIAIASGKGGTGKTTLAVNWSKMLAEDHKIVLYDLDVEEPNCNIFLKMNNLDVTVSTRKLPVVDEELCTHCGICSEKCEFNAIAVAKNFFQLFKELCHSCGRCVNVCPEDALSEVEDRIGEISYAVDGHLEFIEGKLDVGNLMTKALIHNVKSQEPKRISSPDFIIYDCPPGNTCPTVEAMKGADYVVLVTEPSPFGLHDLAISVEMSQEMGLKTGVVINKSSRFDKLVENYCNEENIPIIGRLPFSREAAEWISKGNLLLDLQIYRNTIQEITNTVSDKVKKQ